MELAAVILAGIAIVVSVVAAVRQHKQGRAMERIAADERDTSNHLLEIEELRHEWEERAVQEASSLQRRLLEIEETRHDWERRGWINEEEEERRRLEISKTATFTVTFAFRDSAKTWARIIARNNGPALARSVQLDVWGVGADGRAEVDRVKGQDHHEAESLQPSESVHVAVAFSMASPGPEDLRYRLTWVDGRAEQAEEKQVPLT